jgi:hypothetical protein
VNLRYLPVAGATWSAVFCMQSIILALHGPVPALCVLQAAVAVVHFLLLLFWLRELRPLLRPAVLATWLSTLPPMRWTVCTIRSAFRGYPDRLP